MNEKFIKNIIRKGEGIEVEFKTASFSLPDNIFETVVAFLNRHGGHILLGVKNNGEIEGVLEDSVEQIKNNFVTGCNNPEILSPTYYLSVEEYEIENKTVLYIRVPESSQVHKTGNRIFDRNEDGDLDITPNHNLVSHLYLRKQTTFSENKIYPYLEITDFEPELFHKIRKLANNQTPNHPWMALTDEELLRSASLWGKDYSTGNEGFTLASVLLLGKEEVIANILPHYKTDAILRVENTDRYDDRDDIRCNLIESYYRLMNFIRKHLPEKFFKEDTQRVNIRDKIFHEIIANLLVHREFLNAFPAKLIIESGRVFTENSNIPHGNGVIDLTNFSPFPKNPVIAKFFKQIGLVEELGSGIRNSFRYSKLYSGKDPEFIEGDIFKTIISIPSLQIEGVKGGVEGVKGGVEGVKGGVEGVKGGVEGVAAILRKEINRIKGRRDTKENILKLFKAIITEEGKTTVYYSINIKIPKKSVERYMKILRENNFVQFKRAKKRKESGYYITDEIKEKLNKNGLNNL